MLSGGKGVSIFLYLSLFALGYLTRIILFPVWLLTGLYTTILVYLGSIESLSLISVKESDKDKVESMTKKDALMFPVFGSCTLFGLYLVFKFFNKDYVNFLFHIYFTVLGTYSVKAIIYDKVEHFFKNPSQKILFKVPKIPYLNDKPVDVNLLDIYCYFLGSIVGAAYFFTKNWTLNNVFGICFSIFGISSIMLGQYIIGFILLGLLFFYDIFWVFGTDVMVTVAKSLDGPIKLMFPKILNPSESITDYSIIGLGDIVIPGIFVALMLRFDVINYLKKHPSKKTVQFGIGNLKFFFFTLFGYVLGIVATLVVMNVFKHAQPALLYLVPGCLLTSIIMGVATGRFKNLWNFNEETELKSISEEKSE